MSAFEIFLWGAFPYTSLTILVVGLIWRYRTDKFGWTTRSSELHEHVILRAASPMFHVGILMVAGGHFVGLLIPNTWTAAVGISPEAYHLGATVLGTFAAVLTIAGISALIYRRRRNRSVFLATTRNDKVMYVLLAVPIALGTFATVRNQVFGDAHGYNYRETISPWLRSIFTLQPDVALMGDVPLSFKLHVLSGFLLLMIWPFTRLVHVISAPLGYTTRPYVVYRSREASVNAAHEERGWDPVSTGPKQAHDARSRGA
ncbi:MAG: respiratory nitrate reductase subunit gamma [Actinomycetota bacterium]